MLFRFILKNSLTLSVLALAVSGAGHAELKGRVFVDKNANSVCDPGEKPLAGVAVTDGLNVTKTDHIGRFSLPGCETTRFVTITTPSGYKTSRTHYIAVADSVNEYDFGLVPYNNGANSSGEHSFIQITDTEIFNTTGNDKWVDDLRKYAATETPAFIIHTGDICYQKGLKEHIGLMNTENMNLPVYYLIGNHDLVSGKYGEELFESIYGPVYYSFDAGNTHYVVTPMSGGDHYPSYTREQVARWLANDLAQVEEHTPVVVFNHDYLTTGNDFVYGNDNFSVNLNDHNLKGWIYGHLHINNMRRQGEVMNICTSTVDKGGIDHSTSAYRVIHVNRNGDLSSDLRYAYIHNNVGVASPQGVTGARNVIANVYSSVAQTTGVTYTCYSNGRPVIKARKLMRSTDFSWVGELPLSKKYRNEPLEIVVTAHFSDGTTAEGRSEFRLIDAPEIKQGGNWNNLAGNASHSAGVTHASLDSTLIMAWATNLGSNIFMTSPLINSGKVFTATVDENLTGSAAIYALDITSGEIVWKYPVKASIKNSIAITGSNLFAQDVEGNLYAIDFNSGKLQWQKKLPINVIPGLIEGLAAADGVVYAGSGKGLGAYEAKTGRLIWQNNEWGQGEGTTSTLSVGDGVVVGSVQWSALYGNDAKGGKLLWAHSNYGLRNRGASAAIHDGLVYLVSEKSIFIIEARSGRIIFRKELECATDATSTPLLTDRHIIFGTSKDGLMALDRETFETAWICPVGDALIYTVPYTRPESATIEPTPILADGIVWVAASDGKVYGVDETTGRVVWSINSGAPFFSSVAASGNALVAGDFGGNVYLFTPLKNE